MRPAEFLRLTVPEFLVLLEARAWQEGRERRWQAQLVTHLLSPKLKKGTNLTMVIQGILGGDPVLEIEQRREKRLKMLHTERND